MAKAAAAAATNENSGEETASLGTEDKVPAKSSADESTPGDRGEDPGKKVAERPEWAPENFWDKDKGELRIEDLAKGFTETKKKLSMRTDDLAKTLKEDMDKERLSKRPESADKYELRLPESVPADAWEWNENDPLLSYARNLAFESGMGQDQFDGMVAAYVESEINKLPDIEGETKRLGEKGKERIERVDQWLAANVSKGAYAALSKVSTKAEIVVAIEELMQKAGAPAFVLDGDALTGQDVLTDAQIKSWMADPKYWDPQRRDAKWVEKVDKAWQKLYPTKK